MNQINYIEISARCSTTSIDATEYLWLELLVDDKVIADFKCYAVDLKELMLSSNNDGEFFIMTCWCGAASCAGIEKGVQVTHDGDFVLWNVFEPKRLNFKFERQLYEAEIYKAIKQGKQLIIEAKYVRNKVPEIVPMQNEEHFKIR